MNNYLKSGTHYTLIRCDEDLLLPVPLPQTNTLELNPKAASISTKVGVTFIKAELTGLTPLPNARSIDWYLDDYYKGTTTIPINATVSDFYKFYNLQGGTFYKVGAVIVGTPYSFSTTTATWDSPSAPTISNTGLSGTTITVSVSSTNATYINVALNSTTHKTVNSSSGSVTFSNLSHGTTYSITARGYRPDGTSGADAGGDLSQRNITTYSKATISNFVHNPPNSTSITLGVAGNNVRLYRFAIYLDAGCTRLKEAKETEQSKVTFENLSPKTQYWARVFGYGQTDDCNVDSALSLSFTTADSKPTQWSWSSAARTAFTGNGAFSNLTANEWNNFVDKTKAVKEWKHGGTIDLSSAKATSGSQMLASQFNLVKNTIGGIISTGIADKKKGDKIIGNDFIILETKLNEILK